MAGKLTPEQVRALHKLWWTAPIRPFHVVRLVGLGILVASWAYLLFVFETVPLHSGITTTMVAAVILLFLGAGVMIVGSGLRGRATRKIAYRPCPACRTTNLWLSAHCSNCGAALPPVTIP